MKNRGLLTRPSISPLGTHKDPTPADLPNQQATNVAAALSRNEMVGPEKESPQPNLPAQDSGQPLRAKASPVPTSTAKRYTLVLKLDSVLRQRLEASLERHGPQARSAAKRAMLLAFRSHLAIIPLSGVPALVSVDAVSYRIDIRLSDLLVHQLLAAVGQNAFEPKATALARSLTPCFASFVRDTLASNSGSVDISRTTETLAEEVQVPG